MKILVALFLLSPLAAVAGYDDPSDVGAPQVRYLSWCVRDVVMSEDGHGRVVSKADCAESGLRCVQQERILGGGHVVYAICK